MTELRLAFSNGGRYVKHIAALVLSAALLLSQIFLPLQAEAENASNVVEFYNDFESGYNITATTSNEYSVNEDAQKAHGGSKSLKAVRTTGRNLFRLTDEDGDGITVSAGETVLIHFYVMVEDVIGTGSVNWVQFIPFATGENIGHRNLIGGTNYILNSSTPRGKWQEVMLSFTVTESNLANNRNILALDLYRGNETAQVGNIYIDDLSVVKCAEGSSVILLNSNYENGGIGYTAGVIGSDIGELPTPEREGYVFEGWYTDAASSALYTSEKYAEGTVNLYAGWTKTEYTQDFESGFNITATAPSEFSVNEDAQKAHGGSHSLKAVRASSRNLFRVTDNEGNAVAVKTGETVLIRFYVMVEDVSGLAQVDWVQIAPFLTTTDISSRRIIGGTNYTLGTDTARDKWQAVTLSFTVPALEPNQNLLALDMYRGTKNEQVGNIYIDDIGVRIISAEHTYLKLDYDNSGDTYEILEGEPGAEITLPTPEKEGYTFVGWENRETGEIFTGTTLPEASMTLVAKFSKLEYFAGFEEGTVSAWDGLSVNSDPQHVKSGQYSLKAEKASGGSSFAVLTDNGDEIQLEHGKKYVINLSVKVVDPEKSAKTLLVFLARAGSGISGARTVLTTDQEAIGPDTKQDTWLNYSYVITADLTENPKNNVLLLTYYVGADSVDNTAQLYIDDISVRRVEDTESVITYTYSDLSKQKFSDVGTIGETIAQPGIVNVGYKLDGWYTDAELSKPFEATVYGEEDIAVYAKWSLENANRVWNLNFEDNNFLKGWDGFSLNTDRKYSYNSQNSLLCRRDTQQSTFAFLCDDGAKIQLEEGSTYVVTLRYLVEDSSDADPITYMAFNFATAAANLTNRKVQTTSGLVIDTNTERGRWMEYTFAFTVDTDAPLSNILTLVSYVGIYEGTGDVYIDDITVREYDSQTRAVVFDYNDGTGRRSFAAGKIGSKLTLPTVSREKYKLIGWYSDSALTQLYTDTTVPDKNLFLTAGWGIDQPGNEWHIDFEDYSSFMNSSRTDETYSVDSTVVHDGKYSLKCDYPGTRNAFTTLNLGDMPFVVEQGATYVVSYWTYVPSSRVFTTVTELHFWTSDLNKRTSNIVRHSSHTGVDGTAQPLAWNSPEDIWVQHTTVFTVTEEIGNNVALNLSAKGNPGETVFYIDDMTITKVDPGNHFFLYHTDDDEERDVVIQGKPGQKVSALAGTNKSDCNFDGWFADEKFTTPMDEATLRTIPKTDLWTSVYAKQLRFRYRQDFENYELHWASLERDYELYTPTAAGYDKSNVHSGSQSMHRIGQLDHNKLFSVLQSNADRLLFQHEYVITFWMKVVSYSDVGGYVGLAHTNSFMYARSVDSSASYENILSLSDCKIGEWQKFSYTFTNINSFVSLQTPPNSDIYIDDVMIYLKGFENVDNDGEQDAIVLEPIKNNVPPIPGIGDDDKTSADGEQDENDAANKDQNDNAFGTVSATVWIIIGICVVLLMVGTAAVVLWLRRKKSKKNGGEVK